MKLQVSNIDYKYSIISVPDDNYIYMVRNVGGTESVLISKTPIFTVTKDNEIKPISNKGLYVAGNFIQLKEDKQ